tara:strand:+ start:9840 stop:10460 length:621 start_codon:yes stop_codon:yes gene_type:complete
MPASDFFIDVINTAIKAGVSVRFLNEYSVKYKGLFDAEAFTLDVYMVDHEQNPETLESWLALLAHESSHLDQFVEDADVWNNTSIGYLDTTGLIDSWLDYHIELTQKHLTDYVDKIIACELDCEKRAVAKMKKYKLPIDIKKYIKNSNSVLYTYEVIKTTRAWTKPGNGIVSKKEVFDLIPDTFQKSYKDKKIIDAIINNCYEVSK